MLGMDWVKAVEEEGWGKNYSWKHKPDHLISNKREQIFGDKRKVK